jgi:hypothetical protein
MAALPVPGREDWMLCLFVDVRLAGVAWEVASWPSSEAMSVMREEIMLGGPPWEGGGGSWGAEDEDMVGGSGVCVCVCFGGIVWFVGCAQLVVRAVVYLIVCWRGGL